MSLAAVDGDGNGQICGFGRDSVAYQRLGNVESCRILGLEQLSDERRLELGLAEPQPSRSRPKKRSRGRRRKSSPASLDSGGRPHP